MRLIPWLAVLLIAANLGFCAWTQGGFGDSLPPPGAAQREPERLRQQVRPESIMVLSPKAASAALAQIAAAEAAASAAASPSGASASGVVQTLPGPNGAAPTGDNSSAGKAAPARPR
jgi:hypothetical protein